MTETKRQETSKRVVHELKCWSEYYGRVADGSKTFEVRKNDRGFKTGDVLRLREFNRTMECYSDQQCDVRVLNVYSGLPGVHEGHVVMSIERCSHETDVQRSIERNTAYERDIKELCDRLARIYLQATDTSISPIEAISNIISESEGFLTPPPDPNALKADEPRNWLHDWQMLPAGSYQCLRCKFNSMDAHTARLCTVPPSNGRASGD